MGPRNFSKSRRKDMARNLYFVIRKSYLLGSKISFPHTDFKIQKWKFKFSMPLLISIMFYPWLIFNRSSVWKTRASGLFWSDIYAKRANRWGGGIVYGDGWGGKGTYKLKHDMKRIRPTTWFNFQFDFSKKSLLQFIQTVL